IKGYFAERKGDIVVLANNYMTRQAMTEFSMTFANLGKNKLRELYIKNNPNPEGKKHIYNYAPDGSDYSAHHGKYHPLFRQYLEEYGYYDIFLVDNTGNIVYSVYKELDYATNLQNGEYRDQNIAEAYKKVIDAPRGSVWLVDFKKYAPSKGTAASFIATPIYDDNRKLGVLIFQIPINKIDDSMHDVGDSGKTLDAYLVGQDYLMRNNSRLSKKGDVDILKKKVDTEPIKKALKEKTEVVGTFKDYRGVPVVGRYKTVKLLNLEWLIVVEIDEAEAYGVIFKIEQYLLITAAAISFAVVIIGLIIGNSFARPIIQGVEFASVISQRDLTKSLKLKSRKDEIGDLANSLNMMNNSLEQVVSEMSEVSSTLAATSEEINAAANNLSEGAQNQAASVEETSASTEELTSAIKQVSDHSLTMQEKSNRSLDEAKGYKESMTELTDEMNNISVSTEKIGDIIQVINDIADQTNLLSLNAAIEAARAGEHGKGFAVVAEAISTLASRSADSTKEIEKLIRESIDRINKGVRSVGLSSNSFDSIISTIEENNKIVNDITRSMDEQHQGSEQIQMATEGINSVTQSISASSEEMAGSTGELHNLAERLNGIVGTFKFNGNGHHQNSVNLIELKPSIENNLKAS
ncbi:MAG: methyl-accepting chemotaxis protein, partial [Spirochaetota bacterium]|nr:methyl-accepting chemotaxis protein [Spirochaetota bacterium]